MSSPQGHPAQGRAFDAMAFAREWVDGWNRRDLQALLEHYADDVQFSSPRVAARFQASGVGDPSGTLVGKAALASYFSDAVQKMHSLHLQLQDVLSGVDGSCCVVYTRETGAKVAEVFRLNSSGKVAAVQVFYDAVC